MRPRVDCPRCQDRVVTEARGWLAMVPGSGVTEASYFIWKEGQKSKTIGRSECEEEESCLVRRDTLLSGVFLCSSFCWMTCNDLLANSVHLVLEVILSNDPTFDYNGILYGYLQRVHHMIPLETKKLLLLPDYLWVGESVVVQYEYDAEYYASSSGNPALSHVLTFVGIVREKRGMMNLF